MYIFQWFTSMDFLGDIDHYIGLERGGLACACHEEDPVACQECRLSWQWVDGVAMEYLNWTTTTDRIEPQEGDCGRLTSNGWAENDCSDKFKYICERQVSFLCCINFFQWYVVFKFKCKRPFSASQTR